MGRDSIVYTFVDNLHICISVKFEVVNVTGLSFKCLSPLESFPFVFQIQTHSFWQVKQRK